MFVHITEIICICAFALSAVLSEANKGEDIISVLVLGLTTALGGGTVRDVILSTEQVFWIQYPEYFWAAIISSLVGFVSAAKLRQLKAERIILILDAIGISIFSILVTKKLIHLDYADYVAITMGVITAVFGGVVRDVLVNRPTMFNNTEFYATPVIMGCAAFVGLSHLGMDTNINTTFCIAFIVIFRVYIVLTKKSFPSYLLLK
ncbi:trimeric intracellular cation channel family protein [Vibrio sp. Isolate31]|uniref:trimeric intracellular cation channel family protein n=1 Tax=unclassified Vibrio TaxID=2614977 RepID=UPI001EFD3543|nr:MULTISPECIES: trimeric intracellular cation channel family protein [unclassified Vibrio]MCG9553217.1 trimeric intracellular cation channel family protein [Vibrio sp. Isolate32]MCG9600976.1 trimeric intracellular cation channel family protein [Vibrio sp. Isolate31]